LYDFNEESCFFGKILIGDSMAHGHQVGVNATIAALKIAFSKMQMSRVYLHVFVDNMRAINVYKKVGFQIFDIHKDTNNRDEYTMIIYKEHFEKLCSKQI
jgi:RimJ/RimL family protein N-acetyltransferase